MSTLFPWGHALIIKEKQCAGVSLHGRAPHGDHVGLEAVIAVALANMGPLGLLWNRVLKENPGQPLQGISV